MYKVRDQCNTAHRRAQIATGVWLCHILVSNCIAMWLMPLRWQGDISEWINLVNLAIVHSCMMAAIASDALHPSLRSMSWQVALVGSTSSL